MASGQGARQLARWDDFTGGHWGAQGAETAGAKMWGGRNVLLTRDGALSPCCASRPFVFTNMARAEIIGVHWAWGIDGRVYFVQADGSDFQVRRFEPNYVGGAITIEDVGTPITLDKPRPPAWTDLSSRVFVSFFSDKTYRIDPTGPTMTVLTAGPGDAPGGRAITGFGERLVVACLDDARVGVGGNKVAYSEPADVANFPSLNFFNVGTSDTEIAGLYVMTGDVLIIVMADQTMWSFRGVPGGVSTLRRVYGFHAGAGAINTFRHENAVVDPSQSKLWIFDHVSRGPAQFSGGAFRRVPNFGIVTAERTSELNPDGQLVAMGGPDDVVIDRVPVPRTAGGGAEGEGNELVRVNGAFALVDQTVLTQ